MIRRALLCLAVLCALLGAMHVSANNLDKYNARVGKKFLDEVAKKDTSVVRLKSGMLVKVLKKGSGAKSPNRDDDCTVHYTGKLKDGTVFDSSVARGQPATFKPTQVIRGWTEALQLMREGDKWRVFLPHDIAYGTRGSPPKIPGFAPLVFDMELISVKGAGKTADAAASDFEKATVDGVAYSAVQEGDE
jgi:FKBP-type peptidyl-prolyl cis-trans isomerase FklB